MPVVGLVISTPVFESFFQTLGLSRETYLTSYDNDWICYYSRFLAARGFRVRWYLFSRDVRRPESAVHQPTGSDVRFLPAARLYNWWTVRLPYVRKFSLHLATTSSAFARELRDRPPDVLYVQDYESGRFDVASLLGARMGIPVIGQFHGGHSEASPPLRGLRRWALRRAAYILAPNTIEHRRVRDTYRLSGERARYFPNPVPLPGPVTTSADAVRAALGLATADRYILFVGRLDAGNKGVDLLIAAFRRLAPQQPRVHLVIAGDGPDMGALRAQAADLERTHFLGWVADRARVHSLLAAAAVVVCPSYFEAFCYVAAEAMAAACPVVASAVGGLRDLVVDGHTGLLVSAGDVAGIARAVETLLANPERAREMGERGRARIAAEFSDTVLVPRLTAMLQTAIASRRSSVAR